MKKILLFSILSFSFFLGFSLFSTLEAAQTLEQQVKPYGIKMKDLQTALQEDSSYLTYDTVIAECPNSVVSLTTKYVCLQESKPSNKYAVVTNRDSDIWKILQSFKNSVLLISDNDIIMIEGNFPNTFDGQAFSSKHYLLKYVGTFKYTNTLGSTSTVPKLKLIKELKVN